jgi:2-dehydropantoate 2-reductase
MKIAVFGAGSVGGYLAARLAKAGREVAVIARGDHLAAIRANGLTLETPEERFTVEVEASDDPARIGPVDLVLVTAKTTANQAVAAGIAPLLGPETPVVFAQNGVFWWYGQGFRPPVPASTTRLDPAGRLASAIAPKRRLGLVVHSPNEVRAPGVVRNGSTKNRFVLGAADPARPLDDAAAALDGAGFVLERTADIRSSMWRKLLVNVSTGPVTALTRATAAGVVEDRATAAVSRRLIEEALAVAEAHGFLDLGIDPAALSEPGSRPHHKPSMLQDVERGRALEIDTMARIVQDFAREAEVATPTLDTVLALLVRLARTLGIYAGEG